MYKGSKCNNDSSLHLLNTHKESDCIPQIIPFMSAKSKSGNSKMGTKGRLLTEEEDRKAKALGKRRYNLFPNQHRQLDY